MNVVRPYATEIQRLLERLCVAIDGLTEEQLNWKPPFPDGNSIYAIATHALGNAEAWVLGIACGLPIERDRAAEFRSSGRSPAPIIARAAELSGRFDEVLMALPTSALDEQRPAPQQLWGAGETRSVTVRQALLHVIEHASNHIGHIEITRDLALAR